MQVYVIAASSEPERAKQAAQALTDLGCIVTHRWWDQVLDKGPMNDSTDYVAQQGYALDDVEGVRRAEGCLLLMPSPGVPASFGSGFEAGVAWVLGRVVQVSYPAGGRDSIFSNLLDGHCVQEPGETVEENDAQAARGLVMRLKARCAQDVIQNHAGF